MTKIVRINPEKPKISKIKAIAKILRQGGLVAFPTETVYGLGANALDDKAVKKIFDAKGRPADDPLIVHIADKKEVYRLAKEIPRKAEELIDKFWPGPLTLVLKKSKIVPKITTAGLESVGLRMPACKIAFELIKEARVPVAAPSANLFGKPSPTNPRHVIQDLYGKVDVVIDGGETKIGIESTVLDLTSKPAILLRPGGVTLEELEKVLGKIKRHQTIKRKNVKKVVAKSPGMKYKHYAPNGDVIVVEGEDEKVRGKIHQLLNKYRKEGRKIGVMTTNKNHDYKADMIKFVGDDFDTIAKNLFKTFREFDTKKIEIILVEGVVDKGLGLAIADRLRKASCKLIKL